MIFLIATGIILLLVIIHFYAHEPGRAIRKMFPGPLAIPLLGNSYLALRTLEAINRLLHSVAKQYNFKTIRFWVFHQPFVLVFDYKVAKMILSSYTQIDKASEYRLAEPWIGRGIITETGEKWRRHRKLITPAFHFKILQKFFQVFDSNANVLVKKLEAHNGKEAFNVYKFITLYALDNICDTSMGVQVNALENPNSKYVKAVAAVMGYIYKRIFTPWLKPDMIFKYTLTGRQQKKALEILHDYNYDVIRKRKQNFEVNGNQISGKAESYEKEKKAFLDILLDVSREGQLTEKEVQEEVDSIMFAGHDTLTSSLSFIIYALGEHQDVQEKVYEELKDIFGTSKRDPTYDDLQQMKYMEQVIKETLRFYTPAPVIGRRFNEDFRINENQYIPKNTEVGIFISVIHRDPEIWPNPDVFDPERFTVEECQKRDPFAFIPFSAGPRNCIGQKFAMYEMKITISKILRNFKILLSEKQKDKIRPKFGFIMSSTNGMMIKIESRQENLRIEDAEDT